MDMNENHSQLHNSLEEVTKWFQELCEEQGEDDAHCSSVLMDVHIWKIMSSSKPKQIILRMNLVAEFTVEDA